MSVGFDRRRIGGPEVSYPPYYASAEAGPSNHAAQQAPDEVQSPAPYLITGLIGQANGSGYIELKGEKIACSVSHAHVIRYGPRPKQPPYSPQGTLNLEVKFAPFASTPRRAPLRDTEPVSLSTLLTQLLLPALHLHLLPKSTIDVYLLVLESDSLAGILSAGLTVASAAVADAGIAMGGLGVGATVALKDGQYTVDPSKADAASAQASVSAGIIPSLGRLTDVWLTGELEVEEACEMIERAVQSSHETHHILAQALIQGAETRGI